MFETFFRNRVLWMLFAGVLLVGTVTARSVDQQATPRQTAAITTKSGVYTSMQAARGETSFADNCMGCHAPDTYTAPAFRNVWNNLTLWDLYSYMSEAMPEDAPGLLSGQEYSDIIAYLLQLNRLPTGQTELLTTQDALSKIKIEIGQPEPDATQ